MSIFDYEGTEIPVGNTSHYKNKSLSILGDSISTYAGYIPSGNANFYTGSNCGVHSVNDTWWKKLIDALGMTIKVNNSWSGSRVAGSASSTSAAFNRAASLGTSPDVIIFYMGINDFNNEIGLGTYDGSGTFPTSATTFREAYAITLNTILTTYPSAEVWACTLPYDEKNGETGFPEKNENDVLLATWNQAIRDMANLAGVKILEFSKSGLTYQNMNLYMGDYSSSSLTALHPNAAGHSILANQAIRQLDPSVTTRY